MPCVPASRLYRPAHPRPASGHFNLKSDPVGVVPAVQPECAVCEARNADGRTALSLGWPMSASLIGRLGSSTFRLSTAAVSMSLTGSCFSSESAPGPFHHGIRGRGGTIFTAALPSDERQIQADMRTHLIHRPARDIMPPPGGSPGFLLLNLILHGFHAAAAACSRVQRNSVPSTHMRCMITANRRARATIAFFIPRRLAICIAQALSQDHFFDRSML